jgi:uncharacterized protein YehS (DUF1456 family)
METFNKLVSAAIENCNPNTLKRLLEYLKKEQEEVLKKSPDISVLRYTQGQNDITERLITLLSKVIH